MSGATTLEIRYEERAPAVRRITRIAYEYLMGDDAPPTRPRWWDGTDSPLWLEWHRVRGIDPFEYRGRGHRLPDRVRRAIIARDGYVCGLCGHDVEAADVHIDHIQPRRHGGSDDPSNLQVAHAFCNISKGARVLA